MISSCACKWHRDEAFRRRSNAVGTAKTNHSRVQLFFFKRGVRWKVIKIWQVDVVKRPTHKPPVSHQPNHTVRWIIWRRPRCQKEWNDQQLHLQVTSLFQYGFRISKGTPREMALNQGVMRIDVHL
jgi:hypothetical protein